MYHSGEQRDDTRGIDERGKHRHVTRQRALSAEDRPQRRTRLVGERAVRSRQHMHDRAERDADGATKVLLSLGRLPTWV